MNLFKRIFKKHDNTISNPPETEIFDFRNKPLHEPDSDVVFVTRNSEIRKFVKSEARRLLTIETDAVYDSTSWWFGKSYVSKRYLCRAKYAYWQAKSGVIICETSGETDTTYTIVTSDQFANIVVDNVIRDKKTFKYGSGMLSRICDVNETITKLDIPDRNYVESMIPTI